MNYKNWSNEYNVEAENILLHIKDVRKELKDAAPVRACELRRRIATLYQIYYELKEASNNILEYSKGEEKVG